MKTKLGPLLILILAVALVWLVTEVRTLQSELTGVKAQITASNTKLVSHGLEILGPKGNTVAVIKPENEAGVTLELQSGAKARATFRVKDDEVRQVLVVDNVAKMTAGVGLGYSTFTSGKSVEEPASISISALKDGKTNAPQIGLSLSPQEDGTANPQVNLISPDWTHQSTVKADGFSYQGVGGKNDMVGAELGYENGSGAIKFCAGIGRTIRVITNNSDNINVITGNYDNPVSGNSTQKEAFQRAVTFEGQAKFDAFAAKINSYMSVVAMDPASEYGKAASIRAAQIQTQFDSFMKSMMGH